MSDQKFTPEVRAKHINRLVRSFDAASLLDKVMCKHALGAPKINPETGKEFKSFREVIECSSDHTIDILLDDFKCNDMLLPEEESDNGPGN